MSSGSTLQDIKRRIKSYFKCRMNENSLNKVGLSQYKMGDGVFPFQTTCHSLEYHFFV